MRCRCWPAPQTRQTRDFNVDAKWSLYGRSFVPRQVDSVMPSREASVGRLPSVAMYELGHGLLERFCLLEAVRPVNDKQPICARAKHLERRASPQEVRPSLIESAPEPALATLCDRGLQRGASSVRRSPAKRDPAPAVGTCALATARSPTNSSEFAAPPALGFSPSTHSDALEPVRLLLPPKGGCDVATATSATRHTDSFDRH